MSALGGGDSAPVSQQFFARWAFWKFAAIALRQFMQYAECFMEVSSNQRAFALIKAIPAVADIACCCIPANCFTYGS